MKITAPLRKRLLLLRQASDRARRSSYFHGCPNSPISDYAEVLFCRAFGWTRAGNSAAGFDATDDAGRRYQIEARRITDAPGARQLSAIRNLAGDPFDQLAAVLFSADFSIHRAALIPIDGVRARVRRSAHTNSDVLHLRDEVWSACGVIDVTDRLWVAEGLI